MTDLRFAPLSYALGAEVLGANLSRPLDETDFAALRKALFDRGGVMLIRDQQLDRAQHLSFSRRFGELETHEAVPLDRAPDCPEVLLVDNLPRPGTGAREGQKIGQEWHSDLAPSLRPAALSILRAIQMPAIGGDTLFANMHAAYEALSPGLQALLRGMSAVYIRSRKGVSAEWEKENRRLNPAVAQPLVRLHPETGRPALYLGDGVAAFEGMTPLESRPLIDFLVRHSTHARFVYRHVWQAGDLLIWDNRSVNHLALGDYDPSQVRQLERTTVQGEPSGHLCQPEDIELATR